MHTLVSGANVVKRTSNLDIFTLKSENGYKEPDVSEAFFKTRQYIYNESVFLSVWLLVSRYSKGRAGVPSRLCMQIQQTSVPKISGVPKINDFWHNGLVIKSTC
jgi:hypothetical protein